MQPSPRVVQSVPQAIGILMHPGRGNGFFDAVLPPLFIVSYLVGLVLIGINEGTHWISDDVLSSTGFLELWSIISGTGGVYVRSVMPQVGPPEK